MLTVYGFGPAFGLPDTSPFVLKVQTWLQMARVAYCDARGDLRKAPKKKMPYVADGHRMIADSSHIIEYLEEKHGDPLNEKRFGPRDRAMGQTLKSLFEADLYFIVAYLRWWNDDDFAILKPLLTEIIGASGLPKFVVPAVVALARRNEIEIETGGRGAIGKQAVIGVGSDGLQAGKRRPVAMLPTHQHKNTFFAGGQSLHDRLILHEVRGRFECGFVQSGRVDKINDKRWPPRVKHDGRLKSFELNNPFVCCQKRL